MDYKGTLTWPQGAKNSAPFPEQECRTGSLVELLQLWYSRMGIQPVQNSAVSPNTMSPLPFPEHVTLESTMESCSASQWQESNWHLTSELTEQGEQEGLISDKKQSRFL